MIALDSAAIAAAERLKAYAGARVHRLGEPDELQEEGMPRAKKEAPAETKPKRTYTKRADAPKAAPRSNGKPRFGVFDDGSVTIILPEFKGSMSPEEARQFITFLGKIGIKV
jgi:hypothetical protein